MFCPLGIQIAPSARNISLNERTENVLDFDLSSDVQLINTCRTGSKRMRMEERAGGDPQGHSHLGKTQMSLTKNEKPLKVTRQKCMLEVLGLFMENAWCGWRTEIRSLLQTYYHSWMKSNGGLKEDSGNRHGRTVMDPRYIYKVKSEGLSTREDSD